MSIVPSVSDNEQEIFNSITRFICDFKVGSLLKQCGCKKEKGIAFMKLFTYILCNVFRDRSMYMQKKTGSFKENFSKNAYYRFLRNAHANWLRFTTLLSEKIINGHLRDLTSEDRVDCFVVDDSLYERIMSATIRSLLTALAASFKLLSVKFSYPAPALTPEAAPGSYRWGEYRLCGSLRYGLCSR